MISKGSYISWLRILWNTCSDDTVGRYRDGGFAATYDQQIGDEGARTVIDQMIIEKI